MKELGVAHVFCFGNQSESYYFDMNHDPYPEITKKVTIPSWILSQSLIWNKDLPMAYLGDYNLKINFRNLKIQFFMGDYCRGVNSCRDFLIAKKG